MEKLYSPSNYTHPVEYINGKRYFDYPEDSFERINWEKIKKSYSLKDRILFLFKETLWVVVGQLGSSPLPEKYKMYVDDFILFVKDRDISTSVKLKIEFYNWLDGNSSL